MSRHQRKDAISNTHAGRDFENLAAAFFAKEGLKLTRDYALKLGAGTFKKSHRFDWGSDNPAVLIECKSHRWTEGSKSPSAKIRACNEAMYYFHLAPAHYRKILFVLRDHCPKRQLTLGAHYSQNQRHLIPDQVEIWEYNVESHSAERIA